MAIASTPRPRKPSVTASHAAVFFIGAVGPTGPKSLRTTMISHPARRRAGPASGRPASEHDPWVFLHPHAFVDQAGDESRGGLARDAPSFHRAVGAYDAGLHPLERITVELGER